MKARKWTLCFRKCIMGWLLVSARPAHGRTLKGVAIPRHVLDFAEADERGFVRDKETGKIISGLVNDAYEGKTVQEIDDPAKPQEEPPRLDWDASETKYIGSEEDGVYYGAVEKNGKWWAMATVDSDSGGFTDSLLAELGTSQETALQAAREVAEEWCASNEVLVEFS